MKIKFLIFFTLFSFALLSQSCGTPGVLLRLETQADVDYLGQFIGRGCKTYLAPILIDDDYNSNDRIVDLSPLRGLENINGYLTISWNPLLPNLNGLDSLKTVNSYFFIYGNSSLIDIDALSKLENVGGNFKILENDNL